MRCWSSEGVQDIAQGVQDALGSQKRRVMYLFAVVGLGVSASSDWSVAGVHSCYMS